MALKKKTGNRENGTAGNKPAWKSGLDFIVVVAGAVLIALVIKRFVFDVYQIPSGSMETCLHGRPDGGDRVFCSKLDYLWRPPRRWEVAVFEFPYETALANLGGRLDAEYKGQNFIKRIVGLPGESVALARGDVWTRESGGPPEYVRQVKSDEVQRDVWLKVYREDFSDIRKDEFLRFWRKSGEGDFSITPGERLRLSPGGGGTTLEYRPLVRAGEDGLEMAELPGIPDRYVLEQPVRFKCRAVGPDGRECGKEFVKTVETQNIAGRCPRCGSLQTEDAVVFYHRRSGLAGVGPRRVHRDAVPQGEDGVPPRDVDYFLVPDLRVRVRAVFAGDKSALGIAVSDGARRTEVWIAADGRAEVRLDGESGPGRRVVADIRPGREHEIEFYQADGAVRLFVDSAETPLLDLAAWNDRRPPVSALPSATGVGLSSAGGEVTIRSLEIDRDVFYYTGWERGGMRRNDPENATQMGPQGDVFVSRDSFFPMGDHAPSSFDARSWGPVPLSLLRGPARFIWWPPERARLLATPDE